MAVGIDLGSHQIKAAVLRRADNGLTLSQFAVIDSTAAAQRNGSTEKLRADLQKLLGALGLHECTARVTISCPTATICETEVPRMPIEEVRAAFKLSANSMRYLRRDISTFSLDATELVDPTKDNASKKSPMMRILIAAAPKEDVEWYRDALVGAKIKPETLELAALSTVNALMLNRASGDPREATLLLDIGAQATGINFIRADQLAMVRLMQFGGEHISEAVGAMLSLKANDAEQEKLKMTDTVQPFVRQAIAPLAREIRASIDFFERQQECHVVRAFACGGNACSARILEILSEEAGFRIQALNPVEKLSTTHFNGETPHLMKIAPSLAGAIGAATTPFYKS